MEARPLELSRTGPDDVGVNSSSVGSDETVSNNLNGLEYLVIHALDGGYRNLSSDHREIRLVIILPAADWADDIQCRTATVSLNSTSVTLPYRALSYVWGDGDDRLPIHLNGSVHYVTKNLEHALRRLRRLEYSVLWVDALCINQSDSDERASQIRLMRDIYSSSTLPAVVWLGECPGTPTDPFSSNQEVLIQWDETDERYRGAFEALCNEPGHPTVDECVLKPASEAANSELVFEFIVRLFHGYHVFELPLFELNESEDLAPTTGCINLVTAFRAFVDNPWWQRMWVLQESVLPKSVEFIWGGRSLDFAIIAEAARWLERHKLKRCCFWPPSINGFEKLCDNFVQVVLRIATLREHVGRSYVHLLDLILSHSYRLATDPRDRVYALFGLCDVQRSERGLRAIEIIYEIPFEEVYKRCAAFCILEDDTLDVLLQAGEIGRLPSLPSWVPDWSVQHSSEPSSEALHRKNRILASQYHLYGRTGPAKAVPFDLELQVTGYAVDSIEVIGVPIQWGRKSEYQSILQWQELAGLPQDADRKYAGGQYSVAEAFWRTMIGDYVMTTDGKAVDAGVIGRASAFRRAVREDESRWAALLEFFKDDHYAKGSPERLEEIQLLANRFWDNASCRSFFVSRKGYFGLGPVQMRRGDCVFVLSGATVPYVLRELGTIQITIPAEGKFWMSGVEGIIPRQLMTTQEMKIQGECYELIGECYTHGVMFSDDEINHIKKEVERIYIR